MTNDSSAYVYQREDRVISDGCRYVETTVTAADDGHLPLFV